MNTKNVVIYSFLYRLKVKKNYVYKSINKHRKNSNFDEKKYCNTYHNTYLNITIYQNTQP